VVLAVPISLTQVAAFWLLSLGFFLSLIRAFSRRSPETGATRNSLSRLGILLQAVGIGCAGFGGVRLALAPFSPLALLGTVAVIALMSGSIALFVASSRALGRNWSLVARTRTDHELIRSGPYARVRHPIYLAMLLFLLALAVAMGHWAQLLLAIPLFLAGTKIRTDAEDRLLEQSFGEAFRKYRSGTPAIFPRIV
jgi:protein-S-isoprenylcysteine O-methyltransferase Ste14